jgi:AcrR family transcriptional regulator
MQIALALFAERGFDKTPVSAITSAAGVAQGTFYWHFPTKDHVLVALIERALSRGASAASEILALKMSGRGKIVYALGYLQELLTKDRELWGVVHARTLDSGVVQRAHEDAHEAIVSPFRLLIEQGVADGSIRLSGAIDVTARLIVAMVDFAFTDAQTRDAPGILETVTRLVALILNGEGQQ